MKDIVKNFKDHNVRIQLLDGNPLFCASDVGEILGLSNVYRQVKSFQGGVHSMHTLTNGGEQSLVYISEANLYRLIFKSRKTEAIAFQDWIFEDVIPEIRKTGQYNIPRNLTEKSKEDRKVLTDAWAECGIEKRHHFIQLTLQEYKALGFEKGKRKKDLNKKEILLLNALEAMEALKLFEEKKDGYYECRDSLISTRSIIGNVDNKLIK